MPGDQGWPQQIPCWFCKPTDPNYPQIVAEKHGNQE